MVNMTNLAEQEEAAEPVSYTHLGAINYIRKGIGYDEYLKDYAAYRKLKTEDFYEVLEELAESAKGYKTYPEWFKHMEEYTQNLKEQAKNQPVQRQGVIISTLHSIKGLEFDKVFLMDANEGTIPVSYTHLICEIRVDK